MSPALVRIVIAVSAAFFSLPPCWPAAKVVLKNGDKLTGEIVKSDGKTLVMKTVYAGNVEIQWEAVSEIASDKPVYVILQGDQKLFGRLETEAGQLQVATAQAGVVSVQKSQVVAIRSTPMPLPTRRTRRQARCLPGEDALAVARRKPANGRGCAAKRSRSASRHAAPQCPVGAEGQGCGRTRHTGALVDGRGPVELGVQAASGQLASSR